MKQYCLLISYFYTCYQSGKNYEKYFVNNKKIYNYNKDERFINGGV